jgi:hypothetical protein
MRISFVLVTAITVFAPVPLPAKGETVCIVIRGADLPAPIEIRDPKVIAGFHVWSGPGTSSNEPHGLSIDWSRGAAQVPRGLPIYEVSFVTTRTNPSTYIVHYAFDPATGHGYVYVPGKDDPEYRDNTFLIYRGIEGNWFHAWRPWEELANPLIVKARGR